MQKLDRLGWTDGIAIRSYGVTVGIRVNDSSALERIRSILPPGWKPATSPVVERLFSVFFGSVASKPNVRRFSLLYGGLEQLLRTFDDEQVYATLESNIRLRVAEAARRRLFIHAGAVGWKGQAIIIPGRSYSGKTTLVAELVQRGATYYSDEYAVLDAKGLVHPYLKPLSIRESGAQDQTDYSVEELGGKSGRKPLPVGIVVISDYKEGASWRPRELSAGRGALELLAHSISARNQPGVALSTLHRVASRAAVLKSKRGEASHVVDSILKRIDLSV